MKSPSRSLAGQRLSRTTISICAIVCAFLLLALCVSLEARANEPPLTVSVVSTQAGENSFSVTLRFTARDGAIGVHDSLVPGESSNPVNHVFVLYDPNMFVRFGTPNDVVGLEERIGDYLNQLSTPIPVSLVSSSQLLPDLESNPHAAFIDFAYATIPDNVFSPNTTMLRSWIASGGTLIWAGGPLAYFEGHVTSAGSFVYDNLGWAGQQDLTGFPLEDAIGNPASRSYGPLIGTSESTVGASLGIMYPGTPDGANLTEVLRHNGTDLGFDAAVGSTSERTSLVFVPINQGRLFYFGGAIWGDGLGIVPGADSSLSTDIELLVGTGYSPLPGPTTFTNVTLTYGSPLEQTLSVSGTYNHFVVIVSSTFGPTSLFLWSRQVA